MTEPIDADDSLLRPEINIARLKTEAPVEIRWGGGGISLLFSAWGRLATCSHVFPLLANLCV